MAFFDQLSQKLTQTSQDAVKKTKDMAEVVRLNSAITEETKKIEAGYREIGKLYYEQCADRDDPIFQAHVAEIKQSETLIREMKETISQLKGIRTCPSCGCDLPAGALFCNACGAKMPEPPRAAGPVCPTCGAPVTPGTVFCTNCGAKMPEPAPAPAQPQAAGSVCSICGAKLSPNTVFCTNCGAKVSVPEPEAAPEAPEVPEIFEAPEILEIPETEAPEE